MTRIEIELTGDQVAWLRSNPAALDLNAGERTRYPGVAIMESIKSALPPDGIRLEIELPADVVEVLSRTHWNKVGTIGEDARLALQRISAAAREHEAGR